MNALRHEEKDALLKDGVLPPESSTRGRICVMCPVRIGFPKLLPCCLRENWCHVGCSYQTHLGRMCPCHIRILDPKRKIMVLSHPYMEDCVVCFCAKATEFQRIISSWNCLPWGQSNLF